ncbi:MAG: type II toxin-antitoxin system RelE/ParE family toxin [Anaerolineales bacterium]|nr:type II toxin-antitoxin system RelE/ParE family toxin [Anaerolineales bacterium]
MPQDDRRWQVIIDRQPEKIFRQLPGPLLQRIRDAISGLAGNPWPPGCKKLAGYENLYRVRVGDWRISYAVENDQLIVLIIEVAPRGDAYRF